LANFVVILADGTGNSTHCGGSKLGGAALGKHPEAIRICISKANNSATLSSKSVDSLLAVLVAHEYGHRLSLDHYFRPYGWHGTVLSTDLPAVPQTLFATSTELPLPDGNIGNVFLWMRYWVAQASTTLVSTMLDEIDWTSIFPVRPPPDATPYPLTNPLSSQAGSIIEGWTQHPYKHLISGYPMPSDSVNVSVYHRYYLMSGNTFVPALDEILENYEFAPPGYVTPDSPGDVAQMQPNKVW
jgi:hypothetical protein